MSTRYRTALAHRWRLAAATVTLLATALANPAVAQTTQKPVLHGKHWVAVTGKPLAATAGAITFAATLWAIWLLPQALARMFFLVLTMTLYRLRFGEEQTDTGVEVRRRSEDAGARRHRRAATLCLGPIGHERTRSRRL